MAKLLLKELGIAVKSGVLAIDGIEAKNCNFDFAKSSDIYALDAEVEEQQKEAILQAKSRHDSVGGTALVTIHNTPIGLGEPIYYKLDALLADAMMSINAVKGVEIGKGMHSSVLKGSQNNDQISKEGFLSNKSGGILGGISNGDTIEVKVYFKPTPSIFQKQKTVDIHGNEVECELKGRHDPCVAIRGSIVAESMAALVIADMLLLNMGRKVSDLKKIYT